MGWSATPKMVLIYTKPSGKKPFSLWLNRLKDERSRRRILTRLRNLEEGNFGDSKHLKGGIRELRLFFGPGYRVYFGVDNMQIVVLLCAGEKGSQQKDIEKALIYWKEYVKP